MNENSQNDRGVLNFIAARVESIEDRMATKEDIVRLEDKMATMETRLDAKLSVLQGDVEQVQLRLDSIQRTLSTRLDQMETEISRLRSVLYLLVKDKPELLRLLGQGLVS